MPMCFSRHMPLSIFKIRAILKDRNVTAAFLHSSYAGFIGRIASIGISARLRVFYLPHCISLARQDVGRLKWFVFLMFEFAASLKKAEFLACSRSEFSLINRFFPYRKCTLLENAVAFDQGFKKVAETQVKGGRHTVITVGGVRTQKGVLEFLEIVESIRTIRDDIDFVWVGDGEETLRRQLESKQVLVTGWCNRQEVADYRRRADVYLSCSLWEGMPVAVIEAMADRLPIVVSDCAGNCDVVSHMSNGFIYSDKKQAVEMIFNVISDPMALSSMLDKAYTEARTRFGVDRYIGELDKLI
jgi:glycosyltransferase involved in cell wall biosynthesis